MNEFDFIRDIKKAMPNAWESSAGTGNDCAVFDLEGKGLISKDMLVEHIHFYPDIPMEALAYKSLLVNLSDILADGGTPLFFIIGLGAPKSRAADIQKLYQYFNTFTRQWNTPIIGGDTVKSDEFILSVTCVGQTKNTPWLRKNARPGDFIYTTGKLGGSARGLKLIPEQGHNLNNPFIKRHLMPPYRKKAVDFLHQNQIKVHSAVDVSDGFIQDLFRILEESSTGAEIDECKIPIFDQSIRPENAVFSGEEYELVFTSPHEIDIPLFERETSIPLSQIGVIKNGGPEISLLKNEKKLILKKEDLLDKGFDHWQ